MRTILVEDDPVVRRVIGHALKSRSHDVTALGDGETAWEEFQGSRYDLAILDWVLPELDGLELCRRIRKHPHGDSCYVVVITVRDSPGDLQAVLDAGADDYFPKPISPKLLEIRLTVAEKQSETLRERHRAEEGLRTAFSRLEQNHDDLLSILNQLRMGTALVDGASRITFLSRQGQEMIGLSEEEVLRKAWDDIFPFGDLEKSQVAQELQKPKDERAKILTKISRKGSSRRWVEIEVRDDPRNPERKIFFLYDVSEVHELRQQLKGKAVFQNLVGKSHPMRQVYQLIQDLGEVDTTVLIIGETGTGKELVARAIHESSRRKDGPFIALNCAGLTESLVASQLFGHRRGAFTGALEDRRGMFESANGGTLFLDEIGDVPVSVQINLLRVLETRELQRVGEVQTRKIDVRVLSATNRDLAELSAQGQFRQDLLYRLRIARVQLPPLRERREDIPLLIEWFLNQISTTTGKGVDSVSNEALRALISYSWPGNVRELRNTVEFALIRCKGHVLEKRDLPDEVVTLERPVFVRPTRKQDEKQAILAALEQASGNRSTAAKILGMSRATFYRRLSDYEIDVE
jgi:PAS domain S-box-containing protein